jgi:serine/threonine protein kinase
LAVDTKDVLGERYRIVRPLEGGAGKWVYLAQDLRLPHRTCALIEMIDRFATQAERLQAMRAFDSEVDALIALKCAQLPQIYARFSEGFRHYLVAEFIEGVSLEKRRRKMGGKLEESFVIDVSLRILDALEEMHNCTPSIIYGGLAPSKVMLARNGALKLIDMPLERHFQPPDMQMAARVGGFAPPEMYRGMLEARSDLYALGALMHYLLSGYRPPAASPFFNSHPGTQAEFASSPAFESARSYRNGEQPDAVAVPPLSVLSPRCNPALVELINQALAPEIEHRIGSTREFKYRLQLLKNKPAWTAGAPSPTQDARQATSKPNPPLAAAEDANPVVDPRDLEQRLRELTTRLVSEALGTAVATVTCPECGRRANFDASFCPYCGTAVGGRPALPPPEPPRTVTVRTVAVGPRWSGLFLLMVVVVLMFAASSYYVGNRLVQQMALNAPRATAPPPKPGVAPVKPLAPKRISPQQAALEAKLAQDLDKLKALPAGDATEADLREDIIFTVAHMTPRPPVPAQAQELLDRGEAEVRIATSGADYRKAAAKLSQALRIAPWVAAGYLALAQAQAGAGDAAQAIASYKCYLLAPPAGADTNAVRAAMLKLEPQPPGEELADLVQPSQVPGSSVDGAPSTIVAPPVRTQANTAPAPDLSGIWYRRKTGAQGPLSTQRVRISSDGDHVFVKILADCAGDGCLPGSTLWKVHHHDPGNPVPEYGGRYSLEGKTMTAGPIQWTLPGADGGCQITSRRIGDVAPDGGEIVIRTSDSGSKCRMIESDVRLWRPTS